MKLAIIIPVYNAAKTVGETLASLQAINDGWEHVGKVVLCDDASKDNSAEIIEKFLFDKCPIELIRHEKNKGEAAAYATMIEGLSDDTDWFLILHSDDLALPNFITRNVEIIGKCDSKVASVSSNYWAFTKEGESLSAPERDVILFREGNHENIRTTALVGCWWHISGALVNKRLWCEFGGRSPRFQCAGDWHLVLQWQAAGYTVGHSVIATTKYRLWLDTSLSSSDYPICRDYTDRTAVALDMPNVFSGSTRVIFAGKIFYGAARRGFKFLITGRFNQGLNAFKVSLTSSIKLLVPLKINSIN